MMQKSPGPAGKKVLIIGEIPRSRVARSTGTILKNPGIVVAHRGIGSLVPQRGPESVRRLTDDKEAITWSPDIVHLLRGRMKRQDARNSPQPARIAQTPWNHRCPPRRHP